MDFTKESIRDLVGIEGKRVLIRADYNVPLDYSGKVVMDDSRIRASLPTINYVLRENAKVIIISHLGNPNGRVDKRLSLEPVAKKLKDLLGREVRFLPDFENNDARRMIAQMNPGDVVVLENLRFFSGEESNDSTFSQKLASLADIYVNDSFGVTHREHASMIRIPAYVRKTVAGFLLEKEVCFLKNVVSSPSKPFLAILGGDKVREKIELIKTLLGTVDSLIIAGGMAYTFLKAQGFPTGNSIVQNDLVEVAKDIIFEAKTRRVQLYLPVDYVVNSLSQPNEKKEVTSQCISEGWAGMDIGSASKILFRKVISEARMVLWNGPVGHFEKDEFSSGTYELARIIAQSAASKIIGGAATAKAVQGAGESESMTFISAGGGAMLRLLEGKNLPGIDVIPQKKSFESAA